MGIKTVKFLIYSYFGPEISETLSPDNFYLVSIGLGFETLEINGLGKSRSQFWDSGRFSIGLSLDFDTQDNLENAVFGEKKVRWNKENMYTEPWQTEI